MMNMMMIEEAVKLASDYFEAIGVSITDQCIREEAEDWYSYLDTDSTADGAKELAAVVIQYGRYTPSYDLDYEDIREAVEECFSQSPEYVKMRAGISDDFVNDEAFVM